MTNGNDEACRHALLFVAAIAIHHFPEGIAAGVSFGTGNLSDAVTGNKRHRDFRTFRRPMIIIPPLLKAGTGKKRAGASCVYKRRCRGSRCVFRLLCHNALARHTAVCARLCSGTMLYVIVDDMVPADPHPRQWPAFDLLHAPRLLPYADGRLPCIVKKETAKCSLLFHSISISNCRPVCASTRTKTRSPPLPAQSKP